MVWNVPLPNERGSAHCAGATPEIRKESERPVATRESRETVLQNSEILRRVSRRESERVLFIASLKESSIVICNDNWRLY